MMIISTIQKFSLFLLSFCRLSLTHKLATILSAIFLSKKSKKYSVSYKNLKACYPEQPQDWIEEKAKKSLIEYAKAMIEAPFVYRQAEKNLDKLIENVHSENLIKEAIEENKGVIFMTPHHGSWEMSGLYAASKIKTFTMYKPLRNKILDDFVFKGRETKGSSLVETDNSGVKKLLKALRENYGVGILPDHTPKINQGVMSTFFGVPVNTTTLIYKLSRKNKIPIIYLFAERLNSGKGFDIHVGRVEEEFYKLDEKEAADFLNHIIEILVNKNVYQYLWSYERFRNRSEVNESIYN